MLEKIAWIILLNLVFYFKTLGYKYVSDDIPVSQRPKPKEWWKVRLMQLEGGIRTIPVEDHALTMSLHIIACVFIFLAFGSNDVSFLAAILFSFNPINNQGSVWISGRGYVLSTIGMAGALAFPKIGAIFILLATYSNAGFLAPIALIGSNHPWLLAWAPLCWAFYFRNFRKNVGEKMKMEMYTEDKAIKIEKLIVGIKTASFYLVHSIIPIKTAFYHSYMQSMAGCGREKAYSIKDRFFWIGLAAIGAIIWYMTTHKWDMICFGLLWWMVTIAPFCNVFRMQQEIAERYCYLPNAGLMLVLASLIIKFPILIAVFLTMYATKMWFYMDAYQDDYYLVEQSCLNAPDAWFVWHVRGLKRWDTQSYQEAVIMWTMARIIHPKEFKILFNLASALKMGGIHGEAEQFLALAESNIPSGQEESCGKLISDWRKGQVVIIL